MKKIKVAHVITMLELGGAQGNTLFTAEHLDRAKFDVVLIAGPGGILDAQARKIPNLKVYFAKNLVRPVRPWKDFASVFELERIFREEKPDIVHTHSSKAGILGRIAARRARVPVVIHSIHGFGFNPYQNFFVRKLFIALERWTAKMSRALIAVSRENIEQGLNLGIGKRDQYVLIRSGVDIQKIRQKAAATNPEWVKSELGIPKNRKVAVTVGPFKIQKDPVSFVRLAERVGREFPDVQFVWVGDGELRGKVESEIHNFKLEKRITLLGWRNDIPEILRASDIFVLTSLWEGLPRAEVEALISGKPVVAYAVDGVKEIVNDGENGFLVPPGNLEEMAKKILEILKSPDLEKKFSAAAAKSIDESFDIHRMVKDQEKLYLSLLPG